MHDRISVNSLCFPGASLNDLTGHWRSLEARRVSLASGLLLDGGAAPVKAALAGTQCRLETITHLFLSRGHLRADPECWLADRGRLARLIDIAAHCGARSIYMVTGGHGDLTWEDAADVFSTAIEPCVAQARQAGVTLLVENAPVLYADVHISHSLADTLLLAQTAGIGVCMDLYTCWTEADLRGTIVRALPRLGLVQLGDYVYGDRSVPGRAVPGDGCIAFRRILGWVLEAGYSGAIDLELIGPRLDTEGHLPAVRRAAAHIGGILAALGA
ncbi:MAG: sugar phosphate isomerase/epimerase family protein [Gammaproteobacteria bacterium]